MGPEQRPEAARARPGRHPSPLQQELHDALAAAPRPLTARELTGRMNLDREKKLAEASVYRALGTLMNFGLVHRIGRQRRYAAVEARLADTDRVGLLCEHCECIRFLPMDPTGSGFARAIRERGFMPHRFQIELGGVCRACSLRQSASEERPEVSS